MVLPPDSLRHVKMESTKALVFLVPRLLPLLLLSLKKILIAVKYVSHKLLTLAVLGLEHSSVRYIHIVV